MNQPLNEICPGTSYSIQPADKRNDGTIVCPVCRRTGLRPTNAHRVPAHVATTSPRGGEVADGVEVDR